MKYKCITGGPISENCYLLIDEKTNQAAVVDPGFLNDALLNEIKKKCGAENFADTRPF